MMLPGDQLLAQHDPDLGLLSFSVRTRVGAALRR
jgi:hypothetical protein